MEKPEKESEGPEPCGPSEAQVGEENEPQEQQVKEGLMQDEQTSSEVIKDTENETSVSLTASGSTSHENEQTPTSKTEQDEESRQNVSEEFVETVGMKRKSLDQDCESSVQETSESSGKTSYITSIEAIVEKVMNDMPVEPNNEFPIMALMESVLERSGEARAPMEERQNVSETESEITEWGSESESEEGSEPKSPVREAQQSTELVLEEAASCYERQELVEKVEDIEEPQKYAFREKKT